MIEKRIGTERVKGTNIEELAIIDGLIPLLESPRPEVAASAAAPGPNAISPAPANVHPEPPPAPVVNALPKQNAIPAPAVNARPGLNAILAPEGSNNEEPSSDNYVEASPKKRKPKAGAEEPQTNPNTALANMLSEKKPDAVLAPSLVIEESKPNPCPTLYDPCTREPLSGMPELEKRIRELKRQNDTTPVGLYGLTNSTTNYEFVMGPFLDKTIPLDDLVTFRLNAGGQVGSDIYEVLSRMFVFFGGITDVNPQQGGNYQFMEKVEAAAPRVFAGPREAFMAMKCKADSTSGVSDITLIRAPGAAGGAPRGRPYCESDC
jgi:hypothetical protein